MWDVKVIIKDSEEFGLDGFTLTMWDVKELNFARWYIALTVLP